MKYKIISSIASLFLLTTHSLISYSQSITIDANSLGVIENGKNVIGSGFVFGKNNMVMTCFHVIEKQDSLLFRTIDGNIHVLSVVSTDSINDIAILNSKSKICDAPLILDNTWRTKLLDQIMYIGYNSNESTIENKTLKSHLAYISAIGQQFNYKGAANFIEFVGEGIPGYSGGPVFNIKGKLIGIMKEAWTKEGLKRGPKILINRAFEIPQDIIKN
jgi:serine protease Do